MRKSSPSTRSRLLRSGLATAAIAGLVLAATGTPAFAANAPLTLSSAAGPATGTNTITATSTTTANFLSGITAPVATFSIPVCQTTYNATASAAVTPASATSGNVLVATINKISNTKAAIVVPALTPVVPTGATSTKYNLCVYASNSATAAIIGSATYTVATAATVASVAPVSGPSLGGSIITVTGTNFPTTAGSITATLGGSALTSITPVSPTSFTAVAPSHAPGATTLVVTTAAGPITLASAFTYANGISVTPNTAPNTSAATYLDVLGAGFSSDTFGTSATNAKVWLVDGEYDPGTTASAYDLGPSAECTAPVTISDSEIICKLNLTSAGGLTPGTGVASAAVVPNGTYTVTVVSNGDPAAPVIAPYTQTDISSGSTFTVAPY